VTRLLALASFVLVVVLLLRPTPRTAAPDLVPLAESFAFDTAAHVASLRVALRNRTSGDLEMLGCALPAWTRPPVGRSGPMVLVERHAPGGWSRYATLGTCHRREALLLPSGGAQSVQFVVRAPGRYRAVVLWRPLGRDGSYRRVTSRPILVKPAGIGLAT